MDSEGFVTLAIHTEVRAYQMKSFLQAHSVDVRLEAVSMPYSRQIIGLRVQVRLADLPLALSLIESENTAHAIRDVLGMDGLSRQLLIPVDFSESSMLAVKIAFELALRLKLNPVFLHAFVAQVFSPVNLQADIPDDGVADDIENLEVEKELDKLARKSMDKFVRKIRNLQSSGQLPDVKFDNVVTEGIAEEVIVEATRTNSPALVVMATRGKDKKEEELIGSVTAEVLDSCRVPVFTVPENYHFSSLKDIRNLAVFCNIDRHDIFTIDSLMTMFDKPEVNIFLIPVDHRPGEKIGRKLEALQDYLSNRFPEAQFSSLSPEGKEYRKELDHILEKHNIQLLIVPNKKTNIFSRIFKPTIAHKFLFERDLPILAIPVR